MIECIIILLLMFGGIVLMVYVLDTIEQAILKEIPPCMREPSNKSYHIKRTEQDNSPFIIIDTQGCGYKIIDKKTHEIIAEMLPSGRWINYYLGEKD